MEGVHFKEVVHEGGVSMSSSCSLQGEVLEAGPPEEKIRWEHKSPFCGPRIRLFRVEESGLCIAIPAFVYAKDAVLGILTRCLRDNRVIQ